MNSNSKTSHIVEWGLLGSLALMFAAAGVCWPYVPERIPIHWNLKGEVDGWGSRTTGLFVAPCLAVGVYLLLRFIPRIDPNSENYSQFAKPYLIIRVITQTLLLSIHFAALAAALGIEVKMSLLISVLTGLMLIVVGNYMGKIRPNWFVGVRTPWTLTSKRSWVRTHRQARWVLLASGVATIACGITKSEFGLTVMLVTTLGGSAWLVLYSYLVWRDDPDRVPAMDTSPAEDPALSDPQPDQKSR